MTFNLAMILRESAKATPDKAVLLAQGLSMTYAQLDQQSTRLATGLQAAGLKRGDVVAVLLPNIAEFPIAYFGILKAGMTMMPLNPLLKAREISYHLEDSGTRMVIASAMFLEEASKAAASGEVPLVLVAVPGVQALEGVRQFTELLVDQSVDPVDGDIAPTNADDTAVLIYTSGTTGKAKGAELTHFQMYMGCSVSGEVFGMRRDDVVLAALPFFHVFGLSAVVNTTIRYGASLSVLLKFEAKTVLDALEADRVTIVPAVPTMLHALLVEGPAGRDLEALRVAVVGGASMPGERMKAFEEMFGITVLEGYGLSETASVCSFNRSAVRRKVLSIGQPQWGVEMRIVDCEDRPLSAGPDNVGEIVVRGHNVMKGYVGRPKETAEVLRHGWFHTGDLGYVDHDGYYFVVDRMKDLIIRGGFNVYPREIEEVLYGHSAVAEVAVIGRPDERMGEEVIAVVALNPGVSVTAEAVIAYCREHLASYKCPREVRFMEKLPVNATGKIVKAELR
ncbi:MAG: long-chain acyl-CoA synthetase [Actinomycetota bacterium]|nr:long-chain acyl-CoA synthetase [Actinomycetota bacterium]